MGPILPPQCRPSFQATVLSVEQALQGGDFATAAERLRLLPTASITVEWDDSNAPSAYRDLYKKSGDAAMAMYKHLFPFLSFQSAKAGQANPDIKISFEPVLAKPPGSNLPASHVGFWSEDPAAPRLDFVIGLSRGAPLKASQETDVYDDVAYCLGMYFGLADAAFESSSMDPSDLPRLTRTGVSGTETSAVRRNMQVVEYLEDAVKNHARLLAVQPSLFLDPLVINSQAVQGDQMEFNVQLSNHGDGPLAFNLFPDCGCTIVTPPGVIQPKAMRLVNIAVDTAAFITGTTKHVAVYTNDPHNPVSVITLNIKIQPRYRILVPLGDTFNIPDGGMKFPLYLIPAKGTTLDPVSATITGPLDAKVKFSPWQGFLPDPEMNEGPKARKGFKFEIDIRGDIPTGRRQATLQIFTANADFPDIAYSINAQKGIVALPDNVQMGSVGAVPKSVRFEVTRPGPPFKILGITSNSRNIEANVVPGTGPNTYTIEVSYNGKAHSGELLAAVRVKTSDPKQPVIDVSVQAIVQ